MTRPYEFLRGFVTWATVRYAISGTIVGVFYLGMPIVLNVAFGVALEVSIPVFYVLAAILQFTFQRLFVFRHVERFALPMHRQALWYVVIAAVQYPASAISTAVLPAVLGVPARAVYVVATLLIALLTFLFLRKNVFHSHDEFEAVVDAADRHLADEPVGATRREKPAILR